MEAPPHLTFGVEFEFVVRFDPKNYQPWMAEQDGVLWTGTGESQGLGEAQKYNRMIRAHIGDTLRRHNFPVSAQSASGAVEPGYQKWAVVPDGSIIPELEGAEPSGTGSRFTGIELRTPVFFYTDNAIEEIRQVLKLLTDHFDAFVNTTCGLHVHVGNGHEGFPLETMKNFGSLVSSFERQFNSLHPLHRLDNYYAKPLGRIFPGIAPRDRLAAIDRRTSVEEIVLYFNIVEGDNDYATAYNLANLIFTEKKTIEFRQHAGTLDPTETISWVDLVTGLVSLSHTQPYSTLLPLIEQHIDDSRFSVIDLLHALGLPSVAEYYRQRGIHNHPRQAWE